jgi:hypothetical protein
MLKENYFDIFVVFLFRISIWTASSISYVRQLLFFSRSDNTLTRMDYPVWESGNPVDWKYTTCLASVFSLWLRHFFSFGLSLIFQHKLTWVSYNFFWIQHNPTKIKISSNFGTILAFALATQTATQHVYECMSKSLSCLSKSKQKSKHRICFLHFDRYFGF